MEWLFASCAACCWRLGLRRPNQRIGSGPSLPLGVRGGSLEATSRCRVSPRAIATPASASSPL